MEMRYYNTTDAVEHYALNMNWNSKSPAFDQWHHIAYTRDALGINRLYVDGELINTLAMNGVNMLDLNPSHALFSIGAVDTGTGWSYFLSGEIAVIRIHDGTLSSEDVAYNFKAERNRFGGGWEQAGTGDWNTAANWENDTIPAQNSVVYIDNGGTPVYDGSTYTDGTDTAMLYALNGGLTIAGGTFNALPPLMNDSAIRIGSRTGKTFSLTVSDTGVFTPFNRNLFLGDAAGSTGIIHLASGGRLITPVVQQTSGKGFLTVDGGVLQPTASSSSFLQNLTSVTVQTGGIEFDVKSGRL